MSTTSLHAALEGSGNPRSTLGQVFCLWYLEVLLCTMPVSQEKPGVTEQMTVLSQNGHTLSSVLLDTGSIVTLLSEKLQHQIHNAVHIITSLRLLVIL